MNLKPRKKWNSTFRVKAKPRPSFSEVQAKRRDRESKPARKPDRALAKWSRQVRERDDFTCQMTGVRDVKRNIAHHVAPRSQRPDLRLSMENGVTLTPEAHQKVHDNPVWARANGWLSSETYEKARKAA